MDKRHYRHLNLDDTFSSELLDLYLKHLDATRTYLLASDIAEFDMWRNRLDDELRAGDLDLGFRTFNKFRERLIARLEANVAFLESDAKFDFDADESLKLALSAAIMAPLMAPAEAPATTRKGDGRALRARISPMRLSTPAW